MSVPALDPATPAEGRWLATTHWSMVKAAKNRGGFGVLRQTWKHCFATIGPAVSLRSEE